MGMPPASTAKAITRFMNPEVAASGPRPVCSPQGASSPWVRSESKVVVSQSRLDCTTSPPNAASPRRPSRRYALNARPAPPRDHSSVPRTPNTSSACAPTADIASVHTAPCSAAFASGLVERNDASPSGNAVAVGCSVFRYSRPRPASSSPSSACAGPPTQSGCQALKTSWTYPGSVSSAVLIAPPSSASRSRTQTSQPPRESSAAHASELIPLPTMTASCSATRELPELVVRDDVPLLRAELRHFCQQFALRVVVQIQAELLHLDADRVDPALLAEDDAALRRDDVGGVRLDCRRVVKLARDGARLAAEQVVADERLVRLELVARQRLQPLGEGTDALQPQVRVDAVQPAQRERDLGEVRIARPLAHTVHRPLDPARARTCGGDGGGGCEAEVVVTVEMHPMVAADPLVCRSDELQDRLGCCDPKRVDHVDLGSAGLDGRLVDRLEVGGVRTRPVDAEERHADALLRGERDGPDDALEHRLAVDAERSELQVGDRRLDHARADTELDERLHVSLDSAREPPDLRGQAGVTYQLDRAPVIGGHAWKAGFDPLDPELVQAACELQLVFRREYDADRLLAVAERCVVEADLRVESMAFVDLAGPERHPETQPLGSDPFGIRPLIGSRPGSSTASPCPRQ